MSEEIKKTESTAPESDEKSSDTEDFKQVSEITSPENKTEATEETKEDKEVKDDKKDAEDKEVKDDKANEDDEPDDDEINVPSYGMVNTIFEWVQPLLVALVCVTMLLTFVFRQVTVSGESMQNTLQNNDRLIISGLFYEPQVGDIVVISHGQKYSSSLIKRVIATEGQTLSIDFDTGDVVVDGILLDEPYTYGETKRLTQSPMEVPEVIPEGYVYVMGDHRNASLDSRSEIIGLINKKDIVGKAEFRIFPFSTFGSLY